MYTNEELKILAEADTIRRNAYEKDAMSESGHVFVPGYGTIKIEKLRSEHHKAIEAAKVPVEAEPVTPPVVP